MEFVLNFLFAEEKIFMIPKVKTEKSTTLLIEKRDIDVVDKSDNLHVAGGDHAGLVIQKDLGKDGMGCR